MKGKASLAAACIAALFFAGGLRRAEAAVIYTVAFDTSGFDTLGNPYQMDINLTAANGSGDSSTVTLDNFACSGCRATAQELTDSTFSQDLFIPFTAGGTVSFDLTLSPDLTDLGSFGPDSFQLSILDQFSNPVTTTDPFDAVLFASFDSASPAVDAFGSPENGSPSFAAPVVQQLPASVPEPDSAALIMVAGCYVAAVSGRWLRGEGSNGR